MVSALRTIPSLLAKLCMGLLIWLLPRPGRVDARKKNVLVIRLDGIGDMVLWSDAALALRLQYPADKFIITLLANSSWASLARHMNIADEVWELDRRKFSSSPRYFIETIRRLRSGNFSIAIYPPYSREFFYGDILVNATCAQQRIGYKGDFNNQSYLEAFIGSNWYTRLVACPDNMDMELLRSAHFIRALGVEGFKARIPSLPHMNNFSVFGRGEYYVLFPGAGLYLKRWPVSGFSELADQMHTSTGLRGIICASPDEAHIVEGIINGARAPLEGVTSLSLVELASLITRSAIIISNDTSGVHIGAAAGTPSVCILGGGHFGRFLPYQTEAPSNGIAPVAVYHKMQCYGCNWRCIYKVSHDTPAPCIEKIGVREVLDAALGIIRGNHIQRQ